MGRVGCALDNAAAESLNSILKIEFVYRYRFATRAEVRLKIATWIADFYNIQCRHGAADGSTAGHTQGTWAREAARNDENQ